MQNPQVHYNDPAWMQSHAGDVDKLRTRKKTVCVECGEVGNIR
jgi:hypothetical protein